MRITIDIEPHQPPDGSVAIGQSPDETTAAPELLARAAAMNAHNAGPAPDLSDPADTGSERPAATGLVPGGAAACGVSAVVSDGITNGGAAALGQA